MPCACKQLKPVYSSRKASIRALFVAATAIADAKEQEYASTAKKPATRIVTSKPKHSKRVQN